LITDLLAHQERRREDRRTALDQMTEDASYADLYAGTPEDYAMALKKAPPGRRLLTALRYTERRAECHAARCGRGIKEGSTGSSSGQAQKPDRHRARHPTCPTWLASLRTRTANPIEAQSGPVRTFVMGGSDHRNHPALACKLQACLRWRNAHARHPGVLAAQRRERARIRSERQQRWGRPEPEAA
jgi:hypothetical protein